MLCLSHKWHHGLSLTLSLVAIREPKDDEARLLQLGSEEERPPPLQWLFLLEMVMGCDDVCGNHFREEETFSGK